MVEIMARYLSLLHVLLAASIVGASQSSPIGKNNFTISGQLIYLSITACVVSLDGLHLYYEPLD